VLARSRHETITRKCQTMCSVERVLSQPRKQTSSNCDQARCETKQRRDMQIFRG